MSTTRRIIIATIILIVVVGGILLVQSSRRGGFLYRSCGTGEKIFTEGCVPVSISGKAAGNFCQKDAAGLAKTNFRDRAENKVQEGWLLRDVMLLYIKKEEISPDTIVLVSSTSRGKKAELRWKDISNDQNKILLALSRQGSLKLVSSMKGLDTRDRWVQDVDRIEVHGR